MRKTWMIPTGGSVIALALMTATPANAAGDYSSWNNDSKAGISSYEFNEGFREGPSFKSWDTDDNNVVSPNEYSAGMHRMYDSDGDGSLNDEEFTRFQDDESRVMGADGDADSTPDYAGWETDNQPGISEQEFNTGLTSTPSFHSWDIDDNNVVSANEQSAGVYERYDHDDDGLLNDEEFQQFVEDDEQGRWTM